MSERLHTLQKSFLAGMQGDEAVHGAVATTDPVDAARRVAIYRSSVEHNWRAAMAAVYPVCEAWVGAAFFNEAARQHLAEQPSASGDLGDLGGGFADFLASYAPAASQPVLPDLARLEWAVHRAFHAADAPAQTAQALSSIAPQDLERLVLHALPGTQLIHSPWPLLALWRAHQPAAETNMPEVVAGATRTVLVWREELETALLELDAAEACLVEVMLNKEPLPAALERAPFHDHPDAGPLFMQTLQQVFNLGLVAKLEVLRP